ncbi:hypothetical protein ACA910_000320 [Epithemia clementina (nom. ined.)]
MRILTTTTASLCLLVGATAFLTPHNDGGSSLLGESTATSRTTCCFAVTTREPPIIPEAEPQDIAYGEASRSYRRDVFTHEDWVKFRSQNRFIRNLNTIFYSGIYKGIFKEVMIPVTIATFLVVFNSMVGEYTDLEGVKQMGALHDLGIPELSAPLTPFTLSSPSLGLLLVFRNNKSYKRWDEARKNWGMNINHTRDLVRLASAYYDRTGVPKEVVKQDLERVALATWAFVRAMKRHLSPENEDEQAFQNEVREKLPESQAEKLIAAKHRPNRALQDLSVSIEVLPMHFMRRNEIQAAVTIFEDNLGSSERLLSSPVPLVYSRLSARFTALWLFLLPLGMYGQFGGTWNHIGLIPASAAIAIALFGIEELATQLEEPFTILPMQAFCDKIYNWCNEIVTWEPNDCGMFDDEYRAELNNKQHHTAVQAASPPAELEVAKPKGPIRRLKSIVLGKPKST